MTEKEIEKIIRQEISQKLKEFQCIESKSAFQKTESLLKKYSSFKKRLSVLRYQLDNVELKKCVTFGEIQSGMKYEYLSDFEKLERKKEEIRNSINTYESVIHLIEQGLDSVKSDKYYSVIEMKYLERMKIEDIAEKLEVDESTVKRNKNRLIDEISLVIFEAEILENIFKDF